MLYQGIYDVCGRRKHENRTDGKETTNRQSVKAYVIHFIVSRTDTTNALIALRVRSVSDQKSVER